MSRLAHHFALSQTVGLKLIKKYGTVLEVVRSPRSRNVEAHKTGGMWENILLILIQYARVSGDKGVMAAMVYGSGLE